MNVLRASSCLVLLGLLSGCQHAGLRGYRSYGAPVGVRNCVSVATAVGQATEEQGDPVCVQGRIAEVCQNRGCWMTLSDGTNDIVVRFTASEQCTDGFFVPRNAGELAAYAFGALQRRMISEELARHYAEDQGKTAEEIAAIVGPQPVNSMIATGVLIYDDGNLEAPPDAR